MSHVLEVLLIPSLQMAGQCLDEATVDFLRNLPDSPFNIVMVRRYKMPDAEDIPPK
jgi:hypothetical protein